MIFKYNLFRSIVNKINKFNSFIIYYRRVLLGKVVHYTKFTQAGLKIFLNKSFISKQIYFLQNLDCIMNHSFIQKANLTTAISYRKRKIFFWNLLSFFYLHVS
jgi:hypothetical protein